MSSYTLDEGRIRVGLKQFRDDLHLQLQTVQLSLPEFMRAFGGLEATLTILGCDMPDPKTVPSRIYMQRVVCVADVALNDPKDWPWDLFNILVR